MSTPVWRQIIEGSYDPFSSSFDRRSSTSGGFEGLQTDWRAFQMEEDALRAAERDQQAAEREALELQGQEYVNLSQAQARLESTLGVAGGLGQPGMEPQGPPPALEGIANVLDAAKSFVVGGLSGLMGWDIEGETDDETKFAVSRFTRQEDIVGDRNRFEVAWERALKGLLGGQSYGFGDFEALRYEEDDPRSRRVALGLAAFTFDVAFDPLTYFSFGSSILGRIVASTGVRTVSRSIAQETLQAAGEAATRAQVERLGLRELAQRTSDATGREFSELILRTPQQLADDLFAARGTHFLDAAADSWSFGNAAAYGARGRTGLYDRLVDTVGSELADSAWQRFPADIRGGARIRVPFRRTRSEETGLKLPTIIQFPGSQPGRGFDRLGMGNVIRKMNEARLVLRTGPFKFLENVSGNRGRSWTKVLQAARGGEGEAIEAYAVHFGAMAFSDAYRQITANYDQLASAGMQAISRKLIAAQDANLNPDEILSFVGELYHKRGRADVPQISSPEHVVGLDMVEELWKMTDGVHQLAVELYGEDAARKMTDYATRMLTEDGFKDLVERYGRLEGRRGRLADGTGRNNSSFPKKMGLDKDGKLIVLEYMTPDEIKVKSGRDLFISDPIEAVGEYMIMMRRELTRDWALKQLDDMGLLKSLGEDIIRQPTVRKIQSEVESRLVRIRTTLDRIERGETITELEGALLEAERAATLRLSEAGRLVEVEPGVLRSSDGLVEIRQNRSGGYSASVNGEPVLRPTFSQIQADDLVPELQGPVREVDWDEVRRGFYDSDGNRIPARQVRMEGTDDPQWITSADPVSPTPAGRGPAVAPDADDSREVSGTWEPWLRSGSEADLEYVHKVLRHRIATHESGGTSVSRRAYQIHKRDLEVLEELHPHLRNVEYDNAPVGASSVDPNAKYRIEVGPSGEWRVVDNVPEGTVDRTAALSPPSGTVREIDPRATVVKVTKIDATRDELLLSDGREVFVKRVGNEFVANIGGMPEPIVRAKSKRAIQSELAALSREMRLVSPDEQAAIDRGVLRYAGREAAAPGAPPGVLRSVQEISSEISEADINWSKVGSDHVAYYGDYEIILTPLGGSSGYNLRIVSPDGRTSADRTMATKLEFSKNNSIEFDLPREVRNFELRARERAIRNSLREGEEWPGLSVAKGSFNEYGSSTRVATVDFGDGSSLDLTWNGNTWVSSRKVYGDSVGVQPRAFQDTEWEPFLDALDDLYPGIKRVVKQELPGEAVASPEGSVAFRTRIPDSDLPAIAESAYETGTLVVGRGNVRGDWQTGQYAEVTEELPRTGLHRYQEHDRLKTKKGQKRVAELVEEIQERGFDEPILLEVSLDGRAIISEGNHRLAAAERLGLDWVPVRVLTRRSLRETEGEVVPILEGLTDGRSLRPSEAIDLSSVPVERFGSPVVRRTDVSPLDATPVPSEESRLVAQIIESSSDPAAAGVDTLGNPRLTERVAFAVKDTSNALDQAIKDGDAQAYINAVESFNEIQLAMDRLHQSLRPVGPTSQASRALLTDNAVAFDALWKRISREIALSIDSDIPGANIRGARGTLDQRWRDSTVQYRGMGSQQEYLDFEPPARLAEEYAAAKERMAELAERVRRGMGGWEDDFRILVDDILDLGDESALTAFDLLVVGRVDNNAFNSYLEASRAVLEMQELADLFRAHARNVVSDADATVLPRTAAPTPRPPRPSGPDLPPWELTPEQFEASGRTLYHGTPQQFDFFDSMEATYRGRGGTPTAASGRFYFTDDPEIAGAFRQNVADVDPEQWARRAGYDIEDLETPEVFRIFANDVQQNLERLGARLQIMDDAGDWADLNISQLTQEIVGSETPIRSISDSGQVIETRVFGREIDLTGDLGGLPEDLLEALRLDNLIDGARNRLQPGYRFTHERNFTNTSAWMRENGYGRAVVPDAPESGGQSVIGLQEYIEYGRTPREIQEQIVGTFSGRQAPVEAPAVPEPPPIVPGLRREFAGRAKYVKENGEEFDIVQVRIDGSGKVWRVTDNQGVDIGIFDRQGDAVAFLEGRPVTAPRPPAPPENKVLIREASDAYYRLIEVRDELDRVAQAAARNEPATPRPLTDDDFWRGPRPKPAPGQKRTIEDLRIEHEELEDFILNAIEIIGFDSPATARRLVAWAQSGGGASDFQAILSDAVEDVAVRAPRATQPEADAASRYFGPQQYFDVQEGVGGAPTLQTPVPRSDFADQDDAAYWANRLANRLRSPEARVVRDEVWETNREALIDRLQEDARWLDEALSDGNLLRNQSEEDFETWVERVTVFLDGVDPSIDPFDNVVDKTRYARAAQEAGIERFQTSGMDPVVARIVIEEDLFGPEILAETIKRHFMLSRDIQGADGFYNDFWRPYYTASKSWMTQGRGYGYTARNIIGSMYNAWLADVRARHFKDSARLLASRRTAREKADEVLERGGLQQGESTVEGWERVFDSELRRILREGPEGFGAMDPKRADLLADSYQTFTDRNYGGRTARSRTWGDILDRGQFDAPVYGAGEVGRRQAELFPGRSIEELTRAQRIANTTIDNPWMRHVTRVNESAEDYLRFAAFLRGVDTYGLEDGGFGAGTWVVGTQFDYASLSDFERRYMKTLIPFYTWTRYNVPLQIRSVWMEPGKVNRLLRFHEEVVKAWTGESKEDNTALPDWLRRRGGWMTTMSTPFVDPESALGDIFNFREDPVAAFIESPLSDLGMLFNATLNPLQLLNMAEVVNNLNPILGRTAYEFLTGQSYVAGRELDSDAIAPRWAAPWAMARGRRNEEGELLFSQKWAQAFRNLLPPFAQAERLFAPLLGDERQRRRWLTTVGSQVLATPLYTVDPNQQAFAITQFAAGIDDALRQGIIGYDDKREVAARLIRQGYDPAQVAQLGLTELDPSSLNFDELARARRATGAEDQISRFLETLPPEVAEMFIWRRGFRGRTGAEAVEAWNNRAPVDELGALFLPELNAAFSDWFNRLTEGDKLGFVFRYGYGPYRGAEAVQQWSTRGGLPNIPPGMGSADFLS